MGILGRDNKAAEELTREIDAATDVVKNTETEVDVQRANDEVGDDSVVINTETGVRPVNVRNLGNAALREGSTVQFGFGGENVRSDWQELAQVEAEVAQPERFVGEETALLEEERQQEDLADLRREENLAPSGASEAEKELLASEHRIVKDASKAVTKATMQEVEGILREKVVHPEDLANLWMKESIRMVKEVDGYNLGDNN